MPRAPGFARVCAWRRLLVLILLVLILDLGELGVHHILGLALRPGLGAGAGTRALTRGPRRGQRLRRLLQRRGLGLDAGLVVALHRVLEVLHRGLDRADLLSGDLAAVLLEQ